MSNEKENAATIRATRVDDAFKQVLASLVAAVSLLRRGGREAAPTDKMFTIMLDDYEEAIERGRAALFAQLAMGAADAGAGPLSERLWVDIECAPWVIDAVKKLEAAHASAFRRGYDQAKLEESINADLEAKPNPPATEPCKPCDGRGNIMDMRCIGCDGTGRVVAQPASPEQPAGRQGEVVGFITDEGKGGQYARFNEAGHRLSPGTALYAAVPVGNTVRLEADAWQKKWRDYPDEWGECSKEAFDVISRVPDSPWVARELFEHPAAPVGVPYGCLPFTDAVIDKMQNVMAVHGFVVPVRVISDAFNTTREALAAAPSAPKGESA